MTWRPGDVVMVEDIWKMKTLLPLPCASRVTSAVPTDIEDEAVYIPHVRVLPPISPFSEVPPVSAFAALYAFVASVCAVAAVVSAECAVPLNVPGPPDWTPVNPDIEVPGLTPRSPVTVVAPVLVTAELARTAKFASVLRLTLLPQAPAPGVPDDP